MRHFSRTVTRPVHAHETCLAQMWAVQEGWNPGLTDALIFNAADPGSFIAAEVDAKPIGVISAIRLTPGYGFVGFLILAPEFRQYTHGWSLMLASLDRMEDRVIGVDSLPNRVRHYTPHGLKIDHRTLSYHGITPSRPSAWLEGVENASATPLDELARYDAESVGVPRLAVLREWLAMPYSRALVFKHQGRIRGLGAVRRCHCGVRIGPLHADTPEIASALFDALVGFAPREPISIDCPETNPNGGRLFLEKGLVPGPDTIRLYRGRPPDGVPGRVYGRMSFALG